jgi:hypothetical protein
MTSNRGTQQLKRGHQEVAWLRMYQEWHEAGDLP